MKVHFYCSSIAGNGYQIGEFGGDRHIRLCRAGSPALRYFNMGGLNAVLSGDQQQLTLVLRQLGPVNPDKFRKDRTGARIYVNIAFVAGYEDEQLLRRLMVYYLRNRVSFSDRLYSAYQAAAGGEIGYDFDYAQVNELIVNIINDPLSPADPLKEPRQRYNVITHRDACAQLTRQSLPVRDAVFYADTDMTDTEYAMMHGDMPWYVISERTDLRQSGGDEPESPSFLQRLLDRILPSANGGMSKQRFFLLAGGGAGLLVLILGVILLSSLSPSVPDVPQEPAPTPTATATATAAPTPAVFARMNDTDSDAVRLIQRHLTALGWYSGALSGNFDEATWQAWQAYAAANGVALHTDAYQTYITRNDFTGLVCSIAPVSASPAPTAEIVMPDSLTLPTFDSAAYSTVTLILNRSDGATDTMILEITENRVTLKECLSASEVIVLPHGIAELGSGAFEKCPNLRLLVLDEGVKVIYPSSANWGQVLIRAPKASYANNAARKLGALEPTQPAATPAEPPVPWPSEDTGEGDFGFTHP